MDSFKELYLGDLSRYEPKVKRWTKKFHYYFRRSQTCTNKILKYYYSFRYKMIIKNRGLEIPSNLSVGKGLYIGHPYNITINGTAVLGKNINIHKGVTIGQENRGKRKGAPTIGNNVWIGINSIIVGKITIGDDVLIAPGAYVNCNVPSHSIVLGNPCKIIPKENATQDYINHTVD